MPKSVTGRGQARCAVGCVAQTRVWCCFKLCAHTHSGRLWDLVSVVPLGGDLAGWGQGREGDGLPTSVSAFLAWCTHRSFQKHSSL